MEKTNRPTDTTVPHHTNSTADVDSVHSSVSATKEQNDTGYPLGPVDTLGYASGMRLFTIVIAVVLSIFLVALDMTIVATAIPKITDEFHNLDQVAWIGSGMSVLIYLSRV